MTSMPFRIDTDIFGNVKIHVCYALNLRTHRLTGMLRHGIGCIFVVMLFFVSTTLARQTLLVVTSFLFVCPRLSAQFFRNFIMRNFNENESGGFGVYFSLALSLSLGRIETPVPDHSRKCDSPGKMIAVVEKIHISIIARFSLSQPHKIRTKLLPSIRGFIFIQNCHFICSTLAFEYKSADALTQPMHTHTHNIVVLAKKVISH